VLVRGTVPSFESRSQFLVSLRARLGYQMALVKSSKLAARSVKASSIPTASKSMPRAEPPPLAEKVGASTPALLFERVAAATEEFASGLTEASAAAEQLRKSMEQIGAGAEEAAGAAQEQLAAIKRISEGLRTARGETDALRRRTENVEILLGDTAARITASARAIERNAQRQAATIEIIAELERRASDIGEITQTVHARAIMGAALPWSPTRSARLPRRPTKALKKSKGSQAIFRLMWSAWSSR
jgi:hypothetical protein